MPAHFAIHPCGGLYFAGAEQVRSKLISLRKPKNNSIPATALETLTIIPDSDNNGTSDGNNIANGNHIANGNLSNGNNNANGNNVTNGNINGNFIRSTELLVVYCDAVSRMDYTFLQVSFLIK